MNGTPTVRATLDSTIIAEKRDKLDAVEGQEPSMSSVISYTTPSQEAMQPENPLEHHRSILDFPEELLSLIVCEAVAQDGDARGKISRVSRSFNTIVNDTASLWTEVWLDYPISALLIYLERSKGAALDLRIVLEEELDGNCMAKLAILVAHVSRWGGLTLYWDKGIEGIEKFFDMIAQPAAPMLEKLTIHMSSEDFEDTIQNGETQVTTAYPSIFHGGTPCLRFLELNQALSLPSLSSVTEAVLGLDASWNIAKRSHAYTTMLSLSKIRSLTLDIVSMKVLNLPAIVLVDLESLKISFRGSDGSDCPLLFRIFNVPCLKQLSFAKIEGYQLVSICQAFNEKTPHFPQLRTLAIRPREGVRSFPLELAHACPKLEKFSFKLPVTVEEEMVGEARGVPYPTRMIYSLVPDIRTNLECLLEVTEFLRAMLSNGNDAVWINLASLQIEIGDDKDWKQRGGKAGFCDEIEDEKLQVMDSLRGLLDSRRAQGRPIRKLKLPKLVNVPGDQHDWLGEDAEAFSSQDTSW